MKAGDFIIYYSSNLYFDKKNKCQEFTAIGRVKDDEVYEFEISPDFCPSRLDIEFLEARDVPIQPIIQDLQFIRNKQKWGYPFRWGTLQINEHDFKLIADLMLVNSKAIA